MVVAEDTFDALIRRDRTIDAIAIDPPRPALCVLVGLRGGSVLRKAMNDVLPEESINATPLSLLLDDIAGTALVSSVAWLPWDPDWVKNAFGDLPLETLLKGRAGACIAHAPGSSAQDPITNRRDYGEVIATDLQRPDDPEGWHELGVQTGAGFRRARRMDVSISDVITIDAEFQDSTSRPDGRRNGIHEYSLRMTVDRSSLAVLSVEAEPHVVPYPECPSATIGLAKLLGVRLPVLRERVLAEFAGAAGCTHLNDALRALADIPPLLRHARCNR